MQNVLATLWPGLVGSKIQKHARAKHTCIGSAGSAGRGLGVWPQLPRKCLHVLAPQESWKSWIAEILFQILVDTRHYCLRPPNWHRVP